MSTNSLSDNLSATTSDERFSNRLIVSGCLLLLLPILVALGVFTYLASPLLTLILPRGYQPIGEAAYDEALVLVTSFEDDDINVDGRIDEEILDEVRDLPYYSYSLRSGRVLQAIESHDEARELADDYAARLVIWGDVRGDDVAINMTLLDPISIIEPTEFSLFVEDIDGTAYQQVADFTMALLEMRNAALYYGGYVSVTEWMNRLPYGSSLRLDPTLVAYYRAEAERINGNDSFALTVVEDALDIHEDEPLLLLQYAVLLRSQSRFDEALEAIDQALELDGEVRGGYQLRADIRALEGDAEGAIEDLENALKNQPDDALILATRALLYIETEDYDAALADLDRLIELEPNNYQHLVNQAEVHRLQGDLEEALADYDAAADVARFDTYFYDAQREILSAKADLLLELEEYDAALAAYDEALLLYPDDTSLLIRKGAIQWEQGDEDGARLTWEQNLMLFSFDRGSALNNLGWQLALEGYHEPALPYAEEAVQLTVNDPNIIHTLGFVYLGLERYEDALVEFDRAQNAGLLYDEVNRDIGDAHFGLEQYNQAIASYELYLGLLPYAADRDEVLERLDFARDALSGQ